MFRETLLGAAATAVLFAGAAQAAVTGFVANPATNSAEFAAAAAGLTVVDINFDDQVAGLAFDGSAYADQGVVFSAPAARIRNDAGPRQGNSTNSIPGEGIRTDASPYLFFGPNPSSLIANFDVPVFGAGLFTIDLFSNPGNPLNIEIAAYSGANGTGTLLGSFNALSDTNFQNNGQYFLGLHSTAPIASFVFRDLTNNGGDTFGIDDFVFLTNGSSSEVPIPALGLGFVAAGLIAMRKRQRS